MANELRSAPGSATILQSRPRSLYDMTGDHDQRGHAIIYLYCIFDSNVVAGNDPARWCLKVKTFRTVGPLLVGLTSYRAEPLSMELREANFHIL